MSTSSSDKPRRDRSTGAPGTIARLRRSPGHALSQPSEGNPIPEGTDLAAVARIFLAEGAEVSVGGRFDILGTKAAEHLHQISGDIHLDPSFNRGGDVVHLPYEAQDYTAVRRGSSIDLVSDNSRITIPMGTAGIHIDFAGDDRLLIFDSVNAQALINSQIITSSTVALIA